MTADTRHSRVAIADRIDGPSSLSDYARTLLKRLRGLSTLRDGQQRGRQRRWGRSARRANSARPRLRTKSSGSWPLCRAIVATVRWVLTNGSAVASARSVARAPAASPSKHRTGAAERRQSSSSCSSVSAVPSGATAPRKPGLRGEQSRPCSLRPPPRAHPLVRPRAPDPARRACGAWRTAPSPAR